MYESVHIDLMFVANPFPVELVNIMYKKNPIITKLILCACRVVTILVLGITYRFYSRTQGVGYKMNPMTRLQLDYSIITLFIYLIPRARGGNEQTLYRESVWKMGERDFLVRRKMHIARLKFCIFL